MQGKYFQNLHAVLSLLQYERNDSIRFIQSQNSINNKVHNGICEDGLPNSKIRSVSVLCITSSIPKIGMIESIGIINIDNGP